MVKLALDFSKKCELDVSIICVRSIAPLDCEMLSQISGNVVTLEENLLRGGFGQIVTAHFANSDKNVKVYSLGIGDEFISHGSVAQQLESLGFTVDKLVEICKTI